MPFVPNLQSCYCSFWGLDALNSFPHLGQYYCCLLDLELSMSFLSSFFPWGLCFGSLRQGDLLTTPSEKLSLILHHSSFIALMTISACVVYLLIFPLFVFLYWSGFSNNPFLLVQKGISYWFWVAYEILYESGSRVPETTLRTAQQNWPLHLCHYTKLGFRKLTPPLLAPGPHYLCSRLLHQNEHFCFLEHMKLGIGYWDLC